MSDAASLPQAEPPEPTGDETVAPATVAPEMPLPYTLDDVLDGSVSSAHLAAVALPAEVVRARAHERGRRRRVGRGELRLPGVRTLGRLLLIFPSVVVLVAALWAAGVALGALLTLVRHVITLQFAEAASEFPSLDAAGRIVLASVGYFALLFALRSLARGLGAHGWDRLQLVPGLLVALPSAWLFIAGVELAAGVAPLSSVPADLWRLVVIALLIHAIALAVVTTRQPAVPIATSSLSTPSPASLSGRHARVSPSRSLHDLDDAGAQTRPLPLVRFGPPIEEDSSSDDVPAFRISGLLHVRELAEHEGSGGEPASAPDEGATGATEASVTESDAAEANPTDA